MSQEKEADEDDYGEEGEGFLDEPRTEYLSLNGLRQLSHSAASQLVKEFPALQIQGLCSDKLLLGEGAESVLAAGLQPLGEGGFLLMGDPDTPHDSVSMAGFLEQDFGVDLLKAGIYGYARTDKWLDLGTLRTLSPKQAKAIASFNDDHHWSISIVDLTGLEELGEEVAQILSSVPGILIRPYDLENEDVLKISLETFRCSAELDTEVDPFERVRRIDSKIARAIVAKTNGDKAKWLQFSEVTSLSPEVASILAQSKKKLSLGVLEVSPEVAGALSHHGGGEILFSRLSSLDFRAVEMFARYRGFVTLPRTFVPLPSLWNFRHPVA